VRAAARDERPAGREMEGQAAAAGIGIEGIGDNGIGWAGARGARGPGFEARGGAAG